MAYITTKTMYPGQKGTKKELEIHGDKLVCVRYRYDTEKNQNIKTVELVSDIKPVKRIKNSTPYNKYVYIKVGFFEQHIQRIVKSVGAKWIPEKQLWQMKYGDVFNLGYESRIVE